MDSGISRQRAMRYVECEKLCKQKTENRFKQSAPLFLFHSLTWLPCQQGAFTVEPIMQQQTACFYDSKRHTSMTHASATAAVTRSGNVGNLSPARNCRCLHGDQTPSHHVRPTVAINSAVKLTSYQQLHTKT